MTVVAILARLALAAVFVLSGVAKLRDRAGSRQAVADFGLPAVLISVIAAALPFLELLAALLLVLPDPFRWAGAALSAALLLAFTAGIVVNLLSGRRPDCHCFGQLGAGGIGWSNVVRNSGLVVLAALSATGTGRSVPTALTDLTATQLAFVVESLVLGALAVVVYELVARYGALLIRVESLETHVGIAPPRPAPMFDLPDLTGEPRALADSLATGRPALLAFISPSCVNCTELLPDLARWQLDADDPMDVLVISSGSVADNQTKIGAESRLRVLLQEDGEVEGAYGVTGTPAAVLVDAGGNLASPVAYAAPGVRTLHDNVARNLGAAHVHDHDHHAGREPAVGDVAPDVRVTTETGDETLVAELTADGSVLVFWRSDCSFCEGITQQLADREDTTRVLLVTGSPVGAVRDSGLRSPIVREPDSELTDALLVPGTPSAVRLRAGLVDSDLAVGGPAVLALLDASVDAAAASR